MQDEVVLSSPDRLCHGSSPQTGEASYMDTRSAVIRMRELLHSAADIAKQHDDLAASENRKAAEESEYARRKYAAKVDEVDSQFQQLMAIIRPAAQRWANWYPSVEAQLSGGAALDLQPLLNDARVEENISISALQPILGRLAIHGSTYSALCSVSLT